MSQGHLKPGEATSALVASPAMSNAGIESQAAYQFQPPGTQETPHLSARRFKNTTTLHNQCALSINSLQPSKFLNRTTLVSPALAASRNLYVNKRDKEKGSFQLPSPPMTRRSILDKLNINNQKKNVVMEEPSNEPYSLENAMEENDVNINVDEPDQLVEY